MKGEKDDQNVDCREALHRVYHFLDGELTPERRDQIARHLDECSPRASRCSVSRPRSAGSLPTVAGTRFPTSCGRDIAVAIDHEHQERSRAGGTAQGAEH